MKEKVMWRFRVLYSKEIFYLGIGNDYIQFVIGNESGLQSSFEKFQSLSEMELLEDLEQRSYV